MLTSQASNHILFVVLVVFEILFAISFCVFVCLFFVKKKLTLDEYEIKRQFNEINRTSNIDHFTYLTVLSKNNPQLESLMNDINSSKKFFEDQLKIIKEKIMTLTEENEKFSFTSANSLRAEINADLISCSFMSEKLKKTMSNTTTYSKAVSDLLIQYRILTDSIIEFYELHLSLKYSGSIFKNIVDNIKTSLSSVSEYVIKIDNQKLIVLLNNLNKHILNFYKLVKNLYTLDRTHLYLTSSIRQVDQEINQKNRTLSTSDLLNVEKRHAAAKNNIADLKIHLKNIEISNAYNSAIIAIKSIEEATKIILRTDKVNVLIQKNIKFLDEQINLLTKETETIKKAFDKIVSFFKQKDPTILTKVDQTSHEFRTIALAYQAIITDYKRFSTINRDDLLVRIKELLILIKDLKQKLDDLAIEINTKYKNSIILIDEIADVKLTLSQLLGMKIKLNSSDEDSMNSIRTTINKIEELERLINQDYFANYNSVFNEVQEIKEQIIKIIQTCTFDETLKTYSQRMFIFLNKYRNEAKEIDDNLNLAERYYNSTNYSETLDILIETLQIIKDSSESNNITFN